jgi:Uma2 family endonuclease
MNGRTITHTEAAASLISVEDYLMITADPDCEYVAGVVEKRAVGEYDHATWQIILGACFLAREKELGVISRTELRVQTGADRSRVPDVTLLSRSAPSEQIITHPPLAVFEILSPEDSMTRMLEKLADYERMGIGAIWVIEPNKQLYFRFRQGQLTPATVFELPGSSFSVPLGEIAALHRLTSRWRNKKGECPSSAPLLQQARLASLPVRICTPRRWWRAHPGSCAESIRGPD